MPKKGGDTLFANQYAAQGDLPWNMERRIEYPGAPSGGAPPSDHSANRALRGLGQLVRCPGYAEDEAIDLLDEPKVHATQQKYQCRLRYGVGDLVIWDNASLLHSATLTDPDDPRTLWRITIKEEGPPS
jgi:taurine dioxygenase